VLRAAPLPPDFFGEGIAVVGDRIWQLTWKNGVAIEWDKASFTPLRQVPMSGEGWGLCYDGNRLVRSDGTDRLRFHDPTSFAEIGSVAVTYQGKPFTGSTSSSAWTVRCGRSSFRPTGSPALIPRQARSPRW